MGLQDHMIPLHLVFQGTSMLFSIVALPFTFPPWLWKDFILSMFSAVIILCRSFWWWPLWPVRWYLIVFFGIDLIITDVDYLSLCFYYYFYYYSYILWEQWPLHSGFLKVDPVWNFFLMIYPRTFLEGRYHLQPSWTCDYYKPFSICFKVIWTS